MIHIIFSFEKSLVITWSNHDIYQLGKRNQSEDVAHFMDHQRQKQFSQLAAYPASAPSYSKSKSPWFFLLTTVKTNYTCIHFVAFDILFIHYFLMLPTLRDRSFYR